MLTLVIDLIAGLGKPSFVSKGLPWYNYIHFIYVKSPLYPLDVGHKVSNSRDTVFGSRIRFYIVYSLYMPVCLNILDYLQFSNTNIYFYQVFCCLHVPTGQ